MDNTTATSATVKMSEVRFKHSTVESHGATYSQWDILHNGERVGEMMQAKSLMGVSYIFAKVDGATSPRFEFSASESGDRRRAVAAAKRWARKVARAIVPTLELKAQLAHMVGWWTPDDIVDGTALPPHVISQTIYGDGSDRAAVKSIHRFLSNNSSR